MHPTDAELLAFFLDHIRQHGTAQGMRSAAGVHFGVDRRTIYRWLADLPQWRAIGHDVFRAWRELQGLRAGPHNGAFAP